MNWDYPQPHIVPVMPQAGDIDGLQHTNNAVYVRWCEHAAWHHSKALGLDLEDYRRLDRAMASVGTPEGDFADLIARRDALMAVN